MKLLKPTWVSHDGKPVFSVHIHPDGSRFATGGQGNDSGYVAVWNMQPVVSAKSENDQKVPKLLCSMTNHLSCVNCVRWSNKGKYLASGSDDNDVMIWNFSGRGNQAEIWSCAHILRRHGGDVLDLAWSPDDSYLATSSVDNTIVIWNVDSFSSTPEVKATISNHTGMVKGVSWDPIGKYLASQSDDKSLRVWRTSDWKEESSIRGPFDKVGAVTHVLRLGWSPDGQYVVSTHALNNDGPVAKIVERGSWKACMDFVGHRKAVEVVSFCPKLLKRDGGTYTCCAVGSRDRTLSIWLTCYRRPLVVLHDLFSNSILDISWSRNGLELLACSHDGTVAFLSLTEKEIGNRLNESETNKALKNLYGFTPGRLAEHGANALIENPSILKLRQGSTVSPAKEGFGNRLESDSKKTPVTPSSAGANGSLLQSAPTTPFAGFPSLNMAPVQNFSSSSQPASVATETVKQQQETRTKEGRRRIAPVLLLSKTTASNVPAPFGSSVAADSDVTPPRPDTGGEHSQLESASEMDVTADTPLPVTPVKRKNDEHGAAHGDGADVASGLAGRADAAAAAATSGGAGARTSQVVDKPMTIQPLSPEKPASTSAGTGAGRGGRRKHIELSVKRLRKEAPASKGASSNATASTDGAGTSRSSTAAAAAAAGVTSLTAAQPGGSSSKSLLAASATGLLIASGNAGVLTVPEVQSTLTFKVACLKGADLVFEAKNTPGSQANTVVCSQEGQQLWSIGTYSRILLLTASRHVVGIATEDRCLSVLSIHGRRLQAPMCLAGAAHLMAARDHHIAVVTTTGKVCVWDCRSLRIVVRSDSVISLFNNDSDQLTGLDISSSGHPLVTVNASRTFMYTADMEAWLLLSDHEDPINRLSSYAVRKSFSTGGGSSSSGTAVAAGSSTDAVASSVKGVGDLRPLARLQGLVCADGHREAAIRAGSLLHQDGAQTRLANQAFLENQVAGALALESHIEYRVWLTAYARYLTQEGMEATLKDLCNSMMKGLHNASAPYEQLFVLGISKKSLIKEILVIMATNISLQRCVAQLQEQLEALPSHRNTAAAAVVGPQRL
ncbi:protein HIRA-like [Sycon ciliatum]|uniref:protein HIRA-like n=1 Tax=Sycon ciliatum TaxID=27933 RepID=UPI0031F68E4E